MAVPRIGALTIGQSPRDDVVPEFLAAIGSGAELVQRGALDGLSRAEIASLSPREGDSVLVTRLRDGTEVSLAEELILGRMREGLRELEEEGAELAVIFCTGEFPDLGSRVPLLRPDLVLARVAQAIAPGGHVCAVVPSAPQAEAVRGKWSRNGFEVEIEVLSPYASGPTEVRAAASRTARRPCDLIVLDCIGYTGAIKAAFLEACGKPVLLPRTVLGRVAAELLGI